jgi:WD40 repeat protein
MIFISHSSKDSAAAAALHARLLAREYTAAQLFLDSDAGSGIAAGEEWQQALYARLKDCRALIVLCTRNWLDSKWCFAELVYAKASGKEIFPVLLEPCDVRGVLDAHQAVLVHGEGEAAYERLWSALESRHLGPRDDFGWPPADGDSCPFPGLLSFDERYAGVYFGREPETQAVLEELRRMRANGEPRLLIITGGSGSGKSSLLKAALLPQLTHKTSGTEWLVLPTLRYGAASSPQHTIFDQLALNVAGRFPAEAGADWKVLRDALADADTQRAAKAFLDIVRDLAVARSSTAAAVLLPIDQFEELLAPAAGPDANAFLRFLREVFSCANGRLLAVGTMRSDQLDVYERHPQSLAPPFFESWRLGAFPRERLRDVIVKPAARTHVEVAPDLLERLERDTPSAESLPLLAFTLEKLYRRHAGAGKLELQEYLDLGGMEGAIQTAADRIAPPGSLAPGVLAAVRLTFVKHLASVNDKDEVVRVTARWTDVPEAAKPVLELFVAERLLVKNEHVDEGTRWVSVEVAHEALFRAWPVLKEWLRDAADILRWRRDVQRDRAADPKWSALRPAQLAVARPWRRQRRDELSEEELRWIGRSIRRERMRWATGAFVAVLVCLFGLYAFVKKGEAQHASQVSLGRLLASQASDLTRVHPRNLTRSLLLAIEGYRRDSSAISAVPLRTLMADTPLPIARWRHGERVTDLKFSPDGKWLATAETGGVVRVWDFERGTHIAALERPNTVSTIRWKPDGEQIAAVEDSPSRLALWNWRTADKPFVDTSPLPSAPKAPWLIGLGGEFWLNRINSTSHSKMNQWEWDLDTATDAGDRAAIATNFPAKVRVIDTSTGHDLSPPFVEGANGVRVKALAFSHDGSALAINLNDQITRIWDWQTNKVRARLGAGDPSVTGGEEETGMELAFSPNGKLVAEVGDGHRAMLQVCNTTKKEDDCTAAFLGDEELLGRIDRWVQFSGDGQHLIACLGDSVIRVFDITSDNASKPAVTPVVKFAMEGSVQRVDINRTGTLAAVAWNDGWVTVWKLEQTHPAHELDNASGVVAAPSGGIVALLGPQGRIVDTSSLSTLLETGNTASAVFSVDGKRLAATTDKGIMLVDLPPRPPITPQKQPSALRDTAGATALRFTTDGKQLIAARAGRYTSIDLGTLIETTIFATDEKDLDAVSGDGRFFTRKKNRDQLIRLYDRLAPKKVWKVVSKTSEDWVVLNPAGTLIAGVPDPDEVRVWSTATHAEVMAIPFGNERSGPVVFDPEGRRLAVAAGAKILA